MTLYSADILDLAKPVVKGKKGKKVVVDEPLLVAEKVEEVVETAPPKRQPTEKQLAALARAQESRKRKREEAESLKLEAEKLEEQRVMEEQKNAETLYLKKEAQKEKRRQSREAKKLATPPDTSADGTDSVEDIIASVLEEKPVSKKVKTVVQDHSQPPAWFKQYVAGVKKEESKVSNDKKPQKQIQLEANVVAENQWKDGFTRDRVQNEVDNHMSRMYQMMFSGRRLK
jgi:phage-related minor tail protein